MNAFERVRVKERDARACPLDFNLSATSTSGEFQADAFAGCSALRVPFVPESINTKEHVAQTSCPLMRNRENICREVNRADALLTRATSALCLESIQVLS